MWRFLLEHQASSAMLSVLGPVIDHALDNGFTDVYFAGGYVPVARPDTMGRKVDLPGRVGLNSHHFLYWLERYIVGQNNRSMNAWGENKVVDVKFEGQHATPDGFMVWVAAIVRRMQPYDWERQQHPDLEFPRDLEYNFTLRFATPGAEAERPGRLYVVGFRDDYPHWVEAINRQSRISLGTSARREAFASARELLHRGVNKWLASAVVRPGKYPQVVRLFWKLDPGSVFTQSEETPAARPATSADFEKVARHIRAYLPDVSLDEFDLTADPDRIRRAIAASF